MKIHYNESKNQNCVLIFSHNRDGDKVLPYIIVGEKLTSFVFCFFTMITIIIYILSDVSILYNVLFFLVLILTEKDTVAYYGKQNKMKNNCRRQYHWYHKNQSKSNESSLRKCQI